MKAVENVQYWRAPDLDGLETCQVRKSRHAFPRHSHEGIYAIGLMKEGRSYCLGPEKGNSLVAPGEIALINPGQIHSGVPPRDIHITYHMLYVKTGWMKQAANEMNERNDALPEFKAMVIRNPKLSALIGRACDLIARDGGRLKRETAAMEALTRLLSEYGGVRRTRFRQSNEKRSIRQAKEFLSENLDQKISLENAARAVGLSRYHFLRVFKKETGLPPHVFRTQRRIDLARTLLRQGSPIAQVALEVGFSDQSHFTHKFKQFTGATPRQYVSTTS